MAQITLTIPDDQVDRVRAAFAPRAGKEFDDMTAADVKAVLIDLTKKIVRAFEADAAQAAAREQVTDIDAA